MTSAFAGIAGRLRDASGKLDIGRGEDGGKGEVAAGVRGPRVCEEGEDEEGIAAPGVMFAGNIEDEVEYCLSWSATTHSSNSLSNALSSSWHC